MCLLTWWMCCWRNALSLFPSLIVHARVWNSHFSYFRSVVCLVFFFCSILFVFACACLLSYALNKFIVDENANKNELYHSFCTLNFKTILLKPVCFALICRSVITLVTHSTHSARLIVFLEFLRACMWDSKNFNWSRVKRGKIHYFSPLFLYFDIFFFIYARARQIASHKRRYKFNHLSEFDIQP